MLSGFELYPPWVPLLSRITHNKEGLLESLGVWK